MWSYVDLLSVIGAGLPERSFSLTKPYGYSSYPVELGALPKAWGEHLYPNMVYYKVHDKVR